jgi:hypothetical protein
MAYRKRDYLYPKSSAYGATVLIKNQPPLLLSADSESTTVSHEQMSDEFMDVFCETFYAILDLAESQGLPVLQLCRVPNFIDFVKNNKIFNEFKKR